VGASCHAGFRGSRVSRLGLSSRAMEGSSLAEDVLVDLLRAAWIVEAARADLYRSWAPEEGVFEASAERATERAGMFARALDRVGREPDEGYVERHANWMRALAGSHPDDSPLGRLFVARLGDWVDAHTAGFLGDDADRLRELGEAERSTLKFPSSLPPSPPFEPLYVPEVEPPGDVILRFGILGDLHIGSERADSHVGAAIEDLNRSGAELVIQMGDITDRGERSQFDRAVKMLQGLEMPWLTMMGNHDVFSYEEERLSGREYYGSSFGREPDGVVVEEKGIRFAVLDSVEHGASPFGPFDLVAGALQEGPGGAIVRGALSTPQHEILADIASPGAPPSFVFLHHPPQPYTGFPPVLFGLRDADSGRLHATADSGNVWGIFAGHTHRNSRTTEFGNVPAHEVAIARDYPFGYALVDVTERGYAYRFQQISNEELLRSGTEKTLDLFQRYGEGAPDERAFVWERSQ
jgi:predicted phosphodiesterase